MPPTPSELCKQCLMRYAQEGGICRRCRRANGDSSLVRDLQSRRNRQGPWIYTAPPDPPRLVVIAGREWWSIWNGKESVFAAIDRHKHGVVCPVPLDIPIATA